MSWKSPKIIAPKYIPKSLGERKLWRVMSIKKFLTLLDGKLYFSRMDQFKTCKEGSLPSENKYGLLDMHDTGDVDYMDRQYKASQYKCYVSCWHENEITPDDRVWSTFDPKCRGLAISVRSAGLEKALKTNLNDPSSWKGPAFFGSVDYIDYSRGSIPDYNLLEACFVVQDKYSYQNEARALIYTDSYNIDALLDGPSGCLVSLYDGKDSPTGKPIRLGAQSSGKGIAINIRPTELIVDISINAKVKARTRARIINLLKKHELVGKLIE